MNKALTGKGRRPARGGPFPGIVSVAALIVLWAVVAAISDDPRRLPSPLLVLQRLAEIAATGELRFHAGMTLMRVAIAFVAAMLVGGALGLWMGRAGAADALVGPGALALGGAGRQHRGIGLGAGGRGGADREGGHGRRGEEADTSGGEAGAAHQNTSCPPFTGISAPVM